ncbi:beta-lactamase family protein [Shinella curvata]|uniref:Beta-lactamase family protein n=1 Tax=Shinella curvata TaxID=1817964 RepID=A0ABT8XLF0_9HYPH|nr:serine hydrolase [Shinella curvata]MCJ8056630.1 beta-lactamase family protein [Shinella curvata]MDO6124530.1 beta-lactamase family protein [Shinella curvata]
MIPFATRYGFARTDVRLDNWRKAPWSTWSFGHVRELVPSARIATAAPSMDQAIGDPYGLLEAPLAFAGEDRTIAAALRQTSTDALVVMKNGHVIADFYAPYMAPDSRHIVFSISKSVTGLLAGIVEGDGLLDPDAPVSAYVPEIAGSAYADATVRHLLDMRVSLNFEESYLDTTGAYGRYRRAVLWNPPQAGDIDPTMLGFLRTLRKGSGAHGGAFCYRSPNSDMLGLVIERASGQRYIDLATERLWKPLGATQDAEITVDATGAARAAGGVSMTARDLARLGEMMRRGGLSTTGQRILPAAWVDDTVRTGGSRQAWQESGDAWLPNGRYRNQWYQIGNPTDAFAAVGVHGQWLHVDPSAGTVIAKLSSQPEPSDEACDRLCLALLAELSREAA